MDAGAVFRRHRLSGLDRERWLALAEKALAGRRFER